jgi:hypothetical protein
VPEHCSSGHCGKLCKGVIVSPLLKGQRELLAIL